MLSLSNRATALADPYSTGHQYMQKGNIQGAITSWNQALLLRPDHVDALENRSMARRMIGDLRGALEDVNEVIKRDPFRPMSYWVRGEIYGFQGQFEKAIADFEHLVEQHSSKVPLERIVSSLEHWRKMHELQPVSPTTTETAITEPVITESSTIGSNTTGPRIPQSSPEMSTELATLHDSGTQFRVIDLTAAQSSGSVKAYKEDEEEIIDATYRTLYPIDFIRKARTCISEGNYRDALQELDTALEMDPTLADAYTERGAIYVALGATLKAQIDLDKALALNPQDCCALVNRAHIELLAGTHQNAIPFLQKTFELAPAYPPLHVAYASFCEAGGNYAVAFAAYDRAIQLDKNSAAAFFNRGRMYMKYQMSRRALADFLTTLDLQPNHSRSYYSIGGIYAARGDHEIAEYYYQKAVQFGYEPAQQALLKLQQSEPLEFQPTPMAQWRSDNVDLLAQALVELATFAYAQCGPFAWQEKVNKKALLGLATRSIVETKQRWQVQLQTVNEIDSYGVSRSMQAAVLNLHQSPETVIRILPISSNSYSLSIWTHRSVAGMRNSIFTAGMEDYLTVAWSDLSGTLIDLVRANVLEVRDTQLYYTGKPISHLSRN